jgi:hypothetical protein
MSIKQYPGGIVTKNPTAPTTSSAKGIWTLDQASNYVKQGIWPRSPGAPTIGTATAGINSATVAYTAPSDLGTGAITYTATSTPGSFTGTGASPITVSGLTGGTSYTFAVTGTTPGGTGPASAASNSVTALSDTFWVLQSSNTGNSGNAITVRSSTVDSNGNTILVGISNYIGGSGPTIGLLMSVSPSGVVNFARSYNSNDDVGFNSVCTDSSNNIYISGNGGATTSYAGVFLKYDSSGALQFVKGLGNISDQLSFTSIALGPSNSIWIGGNTAGTSGLISSYTNTGTYVGTWYTGFAWGRAMVSDSSGYAYLSGAPFGSDGVTFSTRIQKINLTPATPVSVWQYTPSYLGGAGIYANISRNIALDSSNNVWWNGWDRDNSNFGLFKLNGSTGAYISGTAITDASSTYRYPAVTIGSGDAIYMTSVDYLRLYNPANPPTSMTWANSLQNSTYTSFDSNSSSINATATSVNTAFGGLNSGSSSRTLCVVRERRNGTVLGTYGSWTYASLSTSISNPYSAGSVSTPGSNLSAYSVVGGQPTITGTDASASITTTLQLL